jgi:hypothetical protein
VFGGVGIRRAPSVGLRDGVRRKSRNVD